MSLGPRGELVAEQTTADLARESRRAARALLEPASGSATGLRDAAARARLVCGGAGRLRIGAVPMPGPNLLTPRDIGYRVGTAGARAAITDAAGRSRLDGAEDLLRRCGIASRGAAARPRVGRLRRDCSTPPATARRPPTPTRRDDPMLLFFTSGTVSYPKMVQQPSLLRAGPRRDRALLARPAARRPPLDGLRHRLGQGGVGRAVRPVARAGDRGAGRARQARRRHDPRDPRASRHHVLLRAADALPAARPGRFRRHDLSRCAIARAPASRSTRR